MSNKLSGIGKGDRLRLSRILQANFPSINSKHVSDILGITQKQSSDLLSEWSKKGWVFRVKQGVYIPVSLTADSPHRMVDEPWVLAKDIFEPYYIGGWSAAGYWGFTEQIFDTTMVFSSRKSSARDLKLSGAKFWVKIIKSERMFGIQSIWIQNQKINISDPSKTIIDAFNQPAVVGGIRMSIDILKSYLNSEHQNLNKLFEYAIEMKNTTIFKRLGYVLEQNNLLDQNWRSQFLKEIKSGYSQLDPNNPGKSINTTWKLWLPTGWSKGVLGR